MAKTSQDFVPIKEIRDGIIVLKNNELRTIVMVSTINFDLKGEDEQAAIISQYQNFLNSLDFSVQIYVQSRRFDIRPYVALLEERLTAQTIDLLKIQTREYIQHIKNLTETSNVMSKLFFIVVPYSPAIITGGTGVISSLFGKKSAEEKTKVEFEQFEEYRSQLEQRRDIVASGLAGLGIKTQQLDTEELVELFYKIFNPGEQDAPVLAQN